MNPDQNTPVTATIQPTVPPVPTEPSVSSVGALPVDEPSTVTTPLVTPLQQLSQAQPTSPSLYTTTEPQLSAPAPQPVQPAYDNIYTDICTQIIREQGRIIGMGLAVEQAQHVDGLTVDPVTFHTTVVGDGSKVINDLIGKYSDFFGHAAVEVCREAAARFLPHLPAEQTPALLKA